ncbi:MAG TPA: S-layer homology domain-containing protein [Acidimicrobiia bacterium]|nr:S-layer homology domain-containing protein [Acidimicrobiia bacterium]
MRRVGGASILTLLVLMGVVLTGAGLAWAALNVTFFDVVETDDWEVWAPGPSGITFDAPQNRMLVVDTDRNNYDEWGQDGIDLWEINLDGTVIRTGVLNLGTGHEPTGIDYDATNDRLFVSNDDGQYHIITPGQDGLFGTGDDGMTTINVAGSTDTEDPVYDPTSENLFVLDGGGTIFRLNPANGNVLGTIDISDLGPDNWEGLAMTPSGELLVGANEDQQIHVISTIGEVLQPAIDVSGINGDGSSLDLVSGLGISTPGAGGSGYDIWIADRQGTSNNDDPANIDGRLWRLSTDGTPPPPPPTTTTTTTTTLPPTTTTTLGPTTTTTTVPSTTTTTVPTTTTTQPADPTPPDPEPDGGFSDTSGHVFENAIAWLADEGITQGCNPPDNTMFCPDDRVTRGQMAAFLVRAFGYTDNGGGDLFIDDNDSVFENAIDRLATAGVTQGCNPPNNTRYCPNDFVTRGQMAAFLGRAFNYTDDGGGDWFIDDNGSVFENAIDRLRTAGVTQGCNPPLNDRYCPNDFVTRGQMAAFLKRAFGA